MIVGHYATALFPRNKMPKVPFWLFLVCAQLPDFLWLFFALIGAEPTTPGNVLDATFAGMRVDMIYSHNLMPTVLLAAIVTLVVLLWRKGLKQALWCGVLILLHFVCDLFVGFEHELVGRDSPHLGLNLYHYNPVIAIILEAVFGAVCVAWFVDAEKAAGRPLTGKKSAALYAVFVLGALIWLPIATTPMRAWFGLH